LVGLLSSSLLFFISSFFSLTSLFCFLSLSKVAVFSLSFSVNVTVSFGTVNVPVTVPAMSNIGQGSTYIGGNDPEPIGSACIVSCDNPAVVLVGFTC
jgi:hypothetical protein